MRAVGLHEFGGPEVLVVLDIPAPTRSRNEVLVRVVAATVNPTDTLFRSGAQADRMIGLQPPFIPGMEFAGVVREVGEAAAGLPLRVGVRVMGFVDPRTAAGGAQAEFVSVSPGSLACVPDAVGLVEAATLPMNGLTATLAVGALEVTAGQTVLVTGASGAVGGYAVQLLRHRGVDVYADVKEEDSDLVLELGATALQPRGSGMSRELLRRLPEGVDGIVDGARLGFQLRPVLREGGTIVSLRRTDAFDGDNSIRHRYVSVTDRLGDQEALAQVARMAGDGVLTPRVAEQLPLDEVRRAHLMVEAGGLRGRVVLMLSEDEEQGAAP